MRILVFTIAFTVTGLAGCKPSRGPASDPVFSGAESPARDTAVTVTVANGLPAEDSARAQVYRLLRTYDLRPWLFTREVRIERGVIPHSHPVLTLHTRYVGQDTRQLGAFVHEQLHWFTEAESAATARAMAALRERYPDVPVGGSEGGGSRASTYEHIIVCYFEFDALRQLIGEAAARKQLAEQRHYRWIYARVLEETEALGDLIAAAGFRAPRLAHSAASGAVSDSAFREVQSRGAGVMGVDQYTSAHVFASLPDGGRIVLERPSPDDTVDIRTIRAHMREIAEQFQRGDFRAPFLVHAQTVPGTREMSRRANVISYVAKDRPRGAELRITTSDPIALKAIHEFLAFQRADHRAVGHEGHPGHRAP